MRSVRAGPTPLRDRVEEFGQHGHRGAAGWRHSATREPGVRDHDGTPRVAPETVWASMTRLQRIIEAERAMVIFHHDPEQWKTLGMLPKFYD